MLEQFHTQHPLM